MTTVEIKSQFVRSIPAENVYRFQLDIIDVVNIEFDVLVFNTSTDTYSHVATVYDLETWPVGKAAAAQQGLAFYRWRGAQLNFKDVSTATHFETVTRGRLKSLAVAWAVVTDSFEGTSIYSVDSNTDV